MREVGLITLEKEVAHIAITMALYILDNGTKIPTMGREKKYGQTVPNLLGNMFMEISAEKEGNFGVMAQYMKVISRITISKAMVNIHGQINENMKEVGLIIRWRGRVCLNGQMGKYTKGIF